MCRWFLRSHVKGLLIEGNNMKENVNQETQKAIVGGVEHTLVVENYTRDGGDYFEFVSLNGEPIDELPSNMLDVAWS